MPVAADGIVWGDCPDCGVLQDEPHDPGCDVERCKRCGWQAIGCYCDPETRPTTWRGRWPGEVEVAEGLASDLNDLALRHHCGDLEWDSGAERLRLVWRDGEGGGAVGG